MIPVLEQFLKYSSLPIIVKPNAGLPKQRDGQTYYDVDPDQFAQLMKKITEMGASVIGGCCGTTPAHIRRLKELCSDVPVIPVQEKAFTVVSSYGQSVFLGNSS